MEKSTRSERESGQDKKPRRANGEGSLTHDETLDRWRGAVTRKDQDGRLHRKAFSGRTRAEVCGRMDDLRSELATGLSPASSGTLAEFLPGWLDNERASVRPSTWRFREGHVKLYLIPVLGRKRLGELTPSDVERMTTDMIGRGLSPVTAAATRGTLRKALGDARRDGLVHRNVAELARPPRVPGREVEYLDRAELRKLLEAVTDDALGPLVTLAATTGLRQGELLGLAWSDVDKAAGILTVRHSMALGWNGERTLSEPETTRSRRSIHLPALAVTALERQQVRQDAARTAAGVDVWEGAALGLVFTDHLGHQLEGRAIGKAFTALPRAGIRHVPFHALRHSWATLALASGVPLKVISDNLGHASIVVTASFYSGIVPELNRDAADAIGRALG